MTARNAIAEADKIRPNAIGEEVKAGWLRDLDGEYAEVMQISLPEDHWPEDQDLLMPEPAARVYVYWLCAMIDWSQQDMEQYQIDQAMYESADAQARAWWRRMHRPRVNMDGSRWHP